ncbi:uncharacterized protein LOC123193591 isoform X1 [Mangifera indica]|uniref:uncharacterized protein LOC123193591 isoform X1 n=1 Tax=Mangifera indica TaxID=29780 RepID=UPI001CF97157|nr:uncharacterized protein LOC123193591 isoform X1 [Mangifera indica]
MSRFLKIGSHSSPPLFHFHHLGFGEFQYASISRVSFKYKKKKKKNCFLNHDNSRTIFSINAYNNASGLSDANNSSPEHEGSSENTESSQAKSFSSNEVLEKLRRYGISGILSYGLLNTAYYLMTFLFVWFYVAPAPGRIGYVAAVERFLKVMAMVWAGSQVTKLLRAGGALALAPVVDKGLSWFTVKFKFESQGKAFMAIVGFCFGLALILFFAITLFSA